MGWDGMGWQSFSEYGDWMVIWYGGAGGEK